ncbi:MAG: tRNA (adenosine(37)-N6)-threonylcarbamoyltransferase complex dimerization subunit type 1 TsaB [Planctomycetaceae bacterium]|nr:tRNA (adenosine(37)-N6)-threonylcarbamoyltransferase complex dimerization subunit type 1 TsaB [Planctomycetaceae bacterium]
MNDAPRWLLALESSTPHGGAALLQNGKPAVAMLLEEGLRHGRELLAAAEEIMKSQNLKATDLCGVAVSTGPGSYTGIRVGVMAAKALAYGAGIRLAAVSSLAALAESVRIAGKAATGDRVMVLQDARRDEVYAGVYRLEDAAVVPVAADAAITPEEAASRLRVLHQETAQGEGKVVLAGSGFHTYATILGSPEAASGRVNPEAVGVLGWRQILREEYADPLQLQPVYLRRDDGADWRHDHLIQTGK